MRLHFALLGSLSLGIALQACGGGRTGNGTDVVDIFVPIDNAPLADTAVVDAAVVDTGLDTFVPPVDTGEDTTPVVDTFDTQPPPDTFELDTFVPIDTASAVDVVEIAVPMDEGTDVVEEQAPPADAGPDACDTREICNGVDDDCDGMIDEQAEADANCMYPNATGVCVNGLCEVATCTSGFGNCDGDDATGCEAPLDTVDDCGSCGIACSIPNGTGRCSAGRCAIDSCEPNFAHCDQNIGNGCETRTNLLLNCGGCGQVCMLSNATESCATGVCEVTMCSSGFADCNPAQPGCETRTLDDEMNCGACGATCDLANATESCFNGACTFSACAPTYGNCDQNPANGCEEHLPTSVRHCGRCGSLCLFANATSACNNGTCMFGGCNPGYSDLNGMLSDGCEFGCVPIAGPDDPDDAFTDSNCDGIDGDESRALFVSPLGSDSNPGTRASPLRTVSTALTTAASRGLSLYVAYGTYAETSTITIPPGVAVYGGYTAQGWVRSNDFIAQIIVADPVAARVRNATARTVIDRIRIESGRAMVAGASAYGLLVESSPGLVVRYSTIVAGNGARGTNGMSNTSTAAPAGAAGRTGSAGCENDGFPCNSCTPPGNGLAGTNAACTSANGGAGGNPGHGSGTGANGSASAGGAAGGLGTPARQGNWNPGSSYVGRDGAGGAAGADGAAGAVRYTAGGYTPTSGGDGAAGGHGIGGGGGGGGGGGADTCRSYGGGGGGGGAGGCGGVGATGGVSAGGSFAIFLWASNATIENCTLESGDGGSGGTGGSGQFGGVGGAPGSVGDAALPNKGSPYGGVPSQDDGSNGARGGRGGNGGRGGHGGGGAGGPSIGVVSAGGSSPTLTSVTFTLGTGGIGGASNGSAGAAGTSANTLSP